MKKTTIKETVEESAWTYICLFSKLSQVCWMNDFLETAIKDLRNLR